MSDNLVKVVIGLTGVVFFGVFAWLVSMSSMPLSSWPFAIFVYAWVAFLAVCGVAILAGACALLAYTVMAPAVIVKKHLDHSASAKMRRASVPVVFISGAALFSGLLILVYSLAFLVFARPERDVDTVGLHGGTAFDLSQSFTSGTRSLRFLENSRVLAFDLDYGVDATRDGSNFQHSEGKVTRCFNVYSADGANSQSVLFSDPHPMPGHSCNPEQVFNIQPSSVSRCGIRSWWKRTLIEIKSNDQEKAAVSTDCRLMATLDHGHIGIWQLNERPQRYRK